MRKILSLLGVCGAIFASQGCSHVGGKCDCTADPVPGSCNYYNTSGTTPQTIPVQNVTPAPAKATPGSYEEIQSPKNMPRGGGL